MSKKRTLDSFFQAVPRPKKPHLEPRASDEGPEDAAVLLPEEEAAAAPPAPPNSAAATSSAYLEPSQLPPCEHPTYPFAIPQLPGALMEALELGTPAAEGSARTDAPHLDIVSWAPFVERRAAAALFRFLRASLPFYRVKYSIKRPYNKGSDGGGGGGSGSGALDIVTPRYTTVFGVDRTAQFVPADGGGDESGKTASTEDEGGGGVGGSPLRPLKLVASSLPTSLSSSLSFPLSSSSSAAAAAAGGGGGGGGDASKAAPPPPLPASAYATCRPRPVPACLDAVRRLVEAFTGAEYNIVLVNYYAGGTDSIAWHSDDERFLGADPTIASLSLGGTRDFLLRHKPLARDAKGNSSAASAGIAGNKGTFGGRGHKKVGGAGGDSSSGADGREGGGSSSNGADGKEGGGGRGEEVEAGRRGGGGGKEREDDDDDCDLDRLVREAHRSPLRFAMAGGDMILMRGPTQSHWLHSVPKRAAGSAGAGAGGRINITFRRALSRAGTENYYRYNVGGGPALRWDAGAGQMAEWRGGG